MTTKKRSRASLRAELSDNEDDQQDELSPRKSDLRSSRTSTPLFNTKKRKLNTYRPSGDGGGGLFGIGKRVGSLVGGFLGLNGEKENLEKEKGEESDDGTIDELAEEADGVKVVEKGRGRGRPRKKSVYDLPSSEDEGAAASVKSLEAKKRGMALANVKVGKTSATKEKAKAKLPGQDVWDVPDSDEERREKASRSSANKNKQLHGTGSAEIGSAQKSKLGRRKSKDVAEEDEGDAKASKRKKGNKVAINIASQSPELEELLQDPEAGSPIPEVRTSARARKVSTKILDTLVHEEGEAELQQCSGRKGGKIKSAFDSSPAPSPQPEPQSSPRKRGRPKKNLDDIIQDAKQGTPKGILTPSKGRTLKNKKSVAFEHPNDDIDLGFKDIPNSASAKKAKKTQNTKEQIGEAEKLAENDPQATCGVCSKKKVPKGNEMLLCDGCDFAVHLKCYNMSEVPEGDWFCQNCHLDDYEVQESVEEEELREKKQDNDAACGVCSKTRVRKGNEMLLCDGCEFAVHLKCYDLSEVPDGDWFCKTCKPGEYSAKGNSVIEEKEQKTLELSNQTDETSCAICSGLDSKTGNKIILCDSCNFAVHVKCYEMLEFPRGDWFCRTCLAVAGKDPFNLGIEDEAVVDEPLGDLPDIEGIEEHLRRVQRVVLDKLTGQRRVKLTGHDDEMQKVYQVVEQTILAGEGNSMLIIGARGCGKTTLVETVVSDLSTEHREKFHVVRLNGFIHTDDKIASKEIWRQLGREMEVEDDKPSNYADTLASLLALLSHPSEHPDADQGQTAKSVVFILDEFDLFTTHSRQTLLYNLFDIAQARKAPIVVLGLTTRIDVVESLEKRVKSRFSHRYVHLSLPRTLLTFWEVCSQGLAIRSDELKQEEDEWPGQSKFLDYWNSMIEDLYTKDLLFKHHLQTQFHRTKSIPSVFTSILLPLATLSPKTLPLTGKKLTPSSNIPSLQSPDSKLHLLPSLSQLSLALLISAARLDIIHDTDTCNFAMAYDEYCALTSKHKIQTSASGVNAVGGSAKVWGREVAVGEWERLADVGLLAPVGFGGGGGGGGRDGGKGGRMWRVDVGLEEIEGSVTELSSVMAKWCREI